MEYKCSGKRYQTDTEVKNPLNTPPAKSRWILNDEQRVVDAARRNLDWALSQQNDQGWYASNAFVAGVPPFTHTIAYAIRGILECGLLLDDDASIAYVSPEAKATDDELTLFWQAVRDSTEAFSELPDRLEKGERFGTTQTSKGRLY